MILPLASTASLTFICVSIDLFGAIVDRWSSPPALSLHTSGPMSDVTRFGSRWPSFLAYATIDDSRDSFSIEIAFWNGHWSLDCGHKRFLPFNTVRISCRVYCRRAETRGNRDRVSVLFCTPLAVSSVHITSHKNQPVVYSMWVVSIPESRIVRNGPTVMQLQHLLAVA